MNTTTSNIRTIAIAGHGQSGKTTLLERILFSTGTIDKMESVENGKTVSDYTQEEIERKFSVYSCFSHLSFNDKVINFWDTPGLSGFVGEVILAFRSSELACIVLDGRVGVQIETIKFWRNLNSRNKARLIFANKMDDEKSDFEHCLQDVKKQFAVDVFPVTIPFYEGNVFKGVIDILHRKAYIMENGKEKECPIPESYMEAYKEKLELLAAASAEGDDDLMIKFIDEGELTAEEIAKGLALGIKDNRIVPFFAGSALTGAGVTSLLRFIDEIVPSSEGALERCLDKNGEAVSVKIDEKAPFSALVVKTSNDQFSGKLSYIKVVQGCLTPDSEVYNLREDKKERIGKLYKSVGKKIVEVPSLPAGDVGIISKLTVTKTNDTLSATQDALPFVKLKTPEPIYSIAVSAKEKKAEDKITEALYKVCEEDMTVSFVFNPETKQNVLSGMGDVHTGIILSKVEKQTKVEIITTTPRIAYRETIQRKAQAEYTHKKQSGGHGQFGRVVLSIAPLARGEKYSFTNAVFGGAISKGYIPGVEKGVLEAMQKGVLAGYPVVDVAVTVLDGKEHPVDSSEMAFKIAGRNAFRNAMKEAGPVLLEPIMNLTVYVESAYLGDIMSDLSSRRGRILGQDSLSNGIEELRAQAPHKELLRYAIDLRSMTSGTGSFEMSFDHYDSISGKTAEEVIAAAKAFMEEIEEE